MPDRVHATNSSPTPPAPITDGLTGRHFGPGTNVPHRFLEGLQESNVRPIEDAGLTPDINNYDQFADVIAGVHAILSEIRSNLSTTGESTYATKFIAAVQDAIVEGDYSAAIAALSPTIRAWMSASIASGHSIIDGNYNADIASRYNTIIGNLAAALASTLCKVTSTGAGAVAIGCGTDTVAADGCEIHGSNVAALTSIKSKVIGDQATVENSVAAVCKADRSGLSGSNCELVKDDIEAWGWAASPPSDHGDGLTNKNLTVAIDKKTGDIHHNGALFHRIQGIGLALNVPWTTEDEVIDAGAISATRVVPCYQITATLTNTSGTSRNIDPGDCFTFKFAVPGSQLVVGAFVESYTASDPALLAARWAVSKCLDHFTVTCINKTAIAIDVQSLSLNIHLYCVNTQAQIF